MSVPPGDIPVHVNVNRAIPTYDSLGFFSSAQFLGADGSNWTIQFPQYPTISPISFTQPGKTPLIVSFEVTPTTFALSAAFGSKKAAITVTPTGPQAYPQFQSTAGSATDVADLMQKITTIFSAAFPASLVGDVSQLRDVCAAARALMTPTAIDPAQVSACYRAVALDLHLIPFQMLVTPTTFWGIAALAGQAAATVSYPLTPATDFIFGNTAGLYLGLVNALFANSGSGGGKPKPVPKTNPNTATQGTLRNGDND
jgi:hypothetical protein